MDSDNSSRQSLTIYPLENYTFAVIDAPLKETEKSTKAKLEALEKDYALSGLAFSMETVIILHQHGHPHLLILQKDAETFMLPSGMMKTGEDDDAALKRVLGEKLSLEAGFKRRNLLGVWWRPNFEIYTYPYCPPHISRPKEQIKIVLVELEDKLKFTVPKALNMIAVPFMDIYENPGRFGQVIASIPHLVSRFDLIPGGKDCIKTAEEIEKSSLEKNE